MYIMGFFVFVANCLATSGIYEKRFVDGKKAGINLVVMKKTAVYHHRLTPFSDGINFIDSHLTSCI